MPRLLVVGALVGACSVHTPDREPDGEPSLPQALLSNELELGVASQVLTGAVRAQQNPSSAIIGSTAFVVWEDLRHDAVGDVFGAFVDLSTHSLLSSQPVVVKTGRQGRPQVVSNGSGYLVVYEEGASPNTDIMGVYVQSNGSVGTPFAIASTASNEQEPAVAFGAGRYMVAWDIGGGAGLVGPIWSVRFADGSTTPGPAEMTGDGPFTDSEPSIGFDGQQFVLAWDEVLAMTAIPTLSCIAMLRIGPTATISGASAGTCVAPVPSRLPDGGTNIKPLQVAPSVANNPAGAGATAIVWADARFKTPVDRVFIARVQNGATIASDVDGGMALALQGGIELLPKVVLGNSALYTAAWVDISSNTALWEDVPMSGGFSTFSQPSPASGVTTLTPSVALSANPMTQQACFVWSETVGSFTELDLFGASGSRGSNLQKSVDFSLSANAQESPAVAAGPAGALAAWADFQGFDAGTLQGFDIAYALRFADGGLATSVLSRASDQVQPSVATAGDAGFFIAWREAADVAGAVISPRGVLIGGGVSLLTPTVQLSEPAVTFDGTQYVVFATDGQKGSTGTVKAVRVNPQGVVVDAVPRALFTTDAGNPYQPAAASNRAGTSLVVAAVQTPDFNSSSNLGLWGMLFIADAGTRGPFRLTSTVAAHPTADFDGLNFFVAWEDARNTLTSGIDVYGAHVDLTGAVLEPSGLALDRSAGDSQHAALAFDGRVHVLAWQHDPRDGGTLDIAGEILSVDAGVLGTFAVATPEHELEPAAASFAGQTLLAYTRWKSSAPYGANRVFGSVVTWGPGSACASNGDCATGYCVGQGAQKICCDQPCTGVCESCFTTPGTCAPLPSTTVCRAADGGCDRPETCDGVTGSCPADLPQPLGVVCRGEDGGCDLAEVCDGVSFSCGPDGVRDAGAVCQNSVLLCALPATCNGVEHECPATGVQGPDVVCRAARDGGCDVEERCDGVSQMCPTDQVALASVRCRSTSSPCDIDEYCMGNSPDCPADLFQPATHACRAAQSTCDVTEFCDGASAVCPADGFAPATVECGPALDECHAPAVCSGSSMMCAASSARPDGTSCNNGAGACNAGECVALLHSRYGWKGCGCEGSGGLMPLFGVLALLVRRRRLGLTLATVIALVAAPVWAAQPEKLKLVFTGIVPGAGVSEETTRSVAEYVQSELTRIGEYRVVSPSDLAAVLGIERQKQLLGCSDAAGSCMAELAGALDADRLLRGELSRIDETIVLNLSIVDLRKNEQVGRVGRRIESGGVSGALREVQPMLYELLNQTPEHKQTPLVYEPGFAFLTIGVRGEGDVLAKGIAPSVFAELSGKYFGAAVTLIATTTPGGRIEGRFYPYTLPVVRPYLGLGAAVFTTGLGLHAGAGVSVRLGHVVLGLEAAYERFVVDFAKGYSPNAVVIALSAGWAR